MIGPIGQRKQYAKGGMGRWYWDYRDRRALAYLRPAGKILDIGCGEGITLEKIIKKFPGRELLGVDSSPSHVEVCQKEGLPVHRGDVYHLEFETDSFDFCLLLEVIEHLGDPQKALQEINRVLKRGGRLVLIFPNDLLFKIARLACGKFKEAFCPAGHVRQWTPREMAGELNQAGFEIRERVCLPFHFWPCSLHCLIAAEKK